MTDFSSVFQTTLGLLILTVIVPIILIALIIIFRTKLAEAKRIPLLLMFAVVYGICIRFFIAPFTGHPVDLNYWAYPIRMFYESGVMNLSLYPMPLTYYPVLLSYSPYALLSLLGFHDMAFLAHNVGMVESLFIKVPFILSDIFSLYFLYKILSRLSPDESNRSKRIGYALLFFLSPVLILTSCAWPLNDGIAVALFLAGIYYAMLDDKPVLGGLLYALSGLTKFFGFIGFIPLAISLIRKKKISKLLITLALAVALTLVVYLPLYNFSEGHGILEFFMQFLRGRAGFGSQVFVASDTYLSYLSFLGYTLNPSYLTYLLMGVFGLVTIYFFLKVRKLNVVTEEKRIVELSLLYFATFFFLFYLIFYRVYNYYYLLVLPLLIMYSYRKNLLGPLLATVFLSVVSAPIFLLSCLVYGAEYYWISLNLPADTSILSVIYSTIAAFAFVSLFARGRLKFLQTGLGISVFTGIATWFSFSLAYYVYYKEPFLGVFWYPISVLMVLMGVAFVAKVLRQRHQNSSECLNNRADEK